MSIALTKKELIELTGCSEFKVIKIDKLLPEDEKLFVKSEADEKKFDLAIFVQRWADYNAKNAKGAKGATAMTMKELASIAGYSYQRLHDLELYLPKDQKFFVRSEADDRKYDLATFVQRWVDYNRQIIEEENEELSAIKAQHEKVKMEKTKIEVARLKGEYVSISAIAPIWSHIAKTVSERFNNLANKIAPSLVMIGDAEIIAELIEREVRDAQAPLSKMPLPDAFGNIPDSDGESKEEKE